MRTDHAAAVLAAPIRRPECQAPLLALGILALIGTLPFWLTDLDIRVAGLFRHPGADDPWLKGGRPLGSLLYRAAPLITGVLLEGASWSWWLVTSGPGPSPMGLPTPYYGVLRIPQQEGLEADRLRVASGRRGDHVLPSLGYGLLALVLLSGTLLATPINDDARKMIRPGELQPDDRWSDPPLTPGPPFRGLPWSTAHSSGRESSLLPSRRDRLSRLTSKGTQSRFHLGWSILSRSNRRVKYSETYVAHPIFSNNLIHRICWSIRISPN